MSPEKEHFNLLTFQAECDNCGEDYDTGEEDFYRALEAIKACGWTVKKIGGEWEHWCDECSKEGLN